jgi:zinc protease
MKNAAALMLAITFVLGAEAQKEAPFPADLPPYGTQPAYQPPEVKASKLDSGLTVWLIPEPGLPKVSFRLLVLGGFSSDPSDRPGMSELLAKTVASGTRTRSSKDIAEQMQLAGGDLETGATRDCIYLAASVLSSRAIAAIGLLSDVAQNATFPDDEVQLARRNLSSSLQQREAEPSFQANRALARMLFGLGPYSVVAPTQSSIEKMTAAQLRNQYAHLFRPDQTVLVVVGDFDSDALGEAIRQQFGSWKSSGERPPAVDAKPGGTVEQKITFVARPNSVQTTLVLGGFGPLRSDSDYEAGQVANAVYGGTFTSRLVTNIREDKGYTYSPGSDLSALRQASIVRTRADVRNAVTGASLNEIFYEMNRMATTSPTDEELNRAKRSLLGTEAIFLQLRSATASEFGNLWLDGLGPQGMTEYNRKVGATTVDDVYAAGRKYFSASRMGIVAVGDEKVIRESLAPFGVPFLEYK